MYRKVQRLARLPCQLYSNVHLRSARQRFTAASVHIQMLPLQVAAAEAQVVSRERDLTNMVAEAEGFLQQERRSRKAARRCVWSPVWIERMLT